MSSENTDFQQEAPEAGSEPKSGDGKSGQILHEVTEYSRNASQRLTREIKAQSVSMLNEQRDRAANKLEALVEALKEAARKLREQKTDTLADMTETSAKSIASISSHLRESDPSVIVREVEDFARRQPALFLGSTLVAGVLLGQLLASPEKPAGEVRVLHPRKESSIEYRPEEDEEGYYERH